MAGIRTCDRESQVQRPNHYTTEPDMRLYCSFTVAGRLIIELTRLILAHFVCRGTAEAQPFSAGARATAAAAAICSRCAAVGMSLLQL